jgi:hypothetical protein
MSVSVCESYKLSFSRRFFYVYVILYYVSSNPADSLMCAYSSVVLRTHIAFNLDKRLEEEHYSSTKISSGVVSP